MRYEEILALKPRLEERRDVARYLRDSGKLCYIWIRESLDERLYAGTFVAACGAARQPRSLELQDYDFWI